MFDFLLNAVATSGTSVTYDWSTLDLSPITSGINSALPVVIPVALGIMAIPLVWGVIRKMINKGK